MDHDILDTKDDNYYCQINNQINDDYIHNHKTTKHNKNYPYDPIDDKSDDAKC